MKILVLLILPIARKNNSIIERCIDFETGKPSITKYEVLDYSIDSNCSLVKCNLITGRTHQIRVHFFLYWSSTYRRFIIW